MERAARARAGTEGGTTSSRTGHVLARTPHGQGVFRATRDALNGLAQQAVDQGRGHRIRLRPLAQLAPCTSAPAVHVAGGCMGAGGGDARDPGMEPSEGLRNVAWQRHTWARFDGKGEPMMGRGFVEDGDEGRCVYGCVYGE